MNKLKNEKSGLRLVVDNKQFRTAVHRSRFGLRRAFLRRVTVISNGAYLTRKEKAALSLAAVLESKYAEQRSHHPFEQDVLIHMAKSPEKDILSAVLKIMRERNYAVTYAELKMSTGGRFSVSRRKV